MAKLSVLHIGGWMQAKYSTPSMAAIQVIDVVGFRAVFRPFFTTPLKLGGEQYNISPLQIDRN